MSRSKKMYWKEYIRVAHYTKKHLSPHREFNPRHPHTGQIHAPTTEIQGDLWQTSHGSRRICFHKLRYVVQKNDQTILRLTEQIEQATYGASNCAQTSTQGQHRDTKRSNNLFSRNVTIRHHVKKKQSSLLFVTTYIF